MNSQKDYWDRKIREWTEASYRRGSGKVSLVEKVAGLFRSGIEGRMRVALETVGPLVRGKTVVDMGCGLGDLCFGILKYQPKKVIGVDISGVAVREARKTAKRKKVADRIEFIQGDLVTMKTWPRFDIALGLGFIDYLDYEELKWLLAKLKGKKFFFSIFEKRLTLLNLIHPLYTKIQGCPGAYKYTKGQMKVMAGNKVSLRFFEENGLLFVTNFFGGKLSPISNP